MNVLSPTPVANTLPAAWVPWVGMPHLFLNHKSAGKDRETGFGPVKHRINAGAAAANIEGASALGTLSLVASTLIGVVRNLVRGINKPSPFFNDETRRPILDPVVLSDEERAAIGL